MKHGKLLFYTHALSGGGAERVAALLASGFARRGEDVVFAVDFEAQENRSFLDPKVRLVVLGGNHPQSTLRLAQLIRREQPDISISALSASNLKHFVAALLAGRLSRAVLSYHGYWSSEPQLLSRIGYLAIPLITRLTAATICVSDGLLRHVVGTWKASRSKSLRIYNPVVTGAYAPACTVADLSARGPVVLACGRLVAYKNFPHLVRAFARVKPAEAQLLILGQGEEMRAVENEIERLQLTDRVRLLGYVAEPWRIYGEACCFVLASDCEPFGLVVVEALAGGLAIVSTDCDGPREILQDGRLGALVAPRDEAALAEAISAAIADPGEPAQRIARARDFSLDIGLANYETLMERITASQKNAQRHAGAAAETEDVAAHPRKILFYTHALTGGGAERAWAILASGFARRGYQVILAVDHESDENKAYLDASVRVEVLGGGHLMTIRRLARLLSRERPGVVLSALGISNLKLFLAAALSGWRRRTILSYHGFFASEPKILSRIAYILTPFTTRFTAATVAVSDVLRDDLVGNWRADPNRVHRVYNPVVWGTAATFPRVGKADGSPLVLASGRLDEQKDFRALVRAFARVEPKNARLVIIGEGPERRAITMEIEKAGLGGRVTLPGYVAEPWNLYAQADCFVVSSRIESFGMVVVEALAHGLPVVSTDCGGPREILADGRFGRIVTPADEAAMADAITAALADPGPAAPRIARAAGYRPHLSLDRYESLVADVIAAAEGRPARPVNAARGN